MITRDDSTNTDRDYDVDEKKEMVIFLLRHFKQTQDFTSFPRQAIIAHQSKLNSYFRALQYL